MERRHSRNSRSSSSTSSSQRRSASLTPSLSYHKLAQLRVFASDDIVSCSLVQIPALLRQGVSVLSEKCLSLVPNPTAPEVVRDALHRIEQLAARSTAAVLPRGMLLRAYDDDSSLVMGQLPGLRDLKLLSFHLVSPHFHHSLQAQTQLQRVDVMLGDVTFAAKLVSGLAARCQQLRYLKLRVTSSHTAAPTQPRGRPARRTPLQARVLGDILASLCQIPSLVALWVQTATLFPQDTEAAAEHLAGVLALPRLASLTVYGQPTPEQAAVLLTQLAARPAPLRALHMIGARRLADPPATSGTALADTLFSAQFASVYQPLWILGIIDMLDDASDAAVASLTSTIIPSITRLCELTVSERQRLSKDHQVAIVSAIPEPSRLRRLDMGTITAEASELLVRRASQMPRIKSIRIRERLHAECLALWPRQQELYFDAAVPQGLPSIADVLIKLPRLRHLSLPYAMPMDALLDLASEQGPLARLTHLRQLCLPTRVSLTAAASRALRRVLPCLPRLCTLDMMLEPDDTSLLDVLLAEMPAHSLACITVYTNAARSAIFRFPRHVARTSVDVDLRFLSQERELAGMAEMEALPLHIAAVVPQADVTPTYVAALYDLAADVVLSTPSSLRDGASVETLPRELRINALRQGMHPCNECGVYRRWDVAEPSYHPVTSTIHLLVFRCEKCAVFRPAALPQ